jgi:hypothetical protein
MKHLSCAVIRRRLSAFCDDELSLSAQIIIEAHLKQCESCTAEVRLIREIGDTLRATAAATSDRTEDDVRNLQATVVPRIKAERAVSVAHWVHDLLDDVHLIWAAGGGVLAGVLCGLLAFAMVHAARTHPESLAVLMNSLANTPPSVAEPLVLPRVHPDAIMPATVMNQQSGEDAESALAVIVLQDGSLSEIELLPSATRNGMRTAQQTRLAFDLLDAVSTARFEPARIAGTPVPFNVVWLLTQTTVRGKAPALPTRIGPVRVRRSSAIAAVVG